MMYLYLDGHGHISNWRNHYHIRCDLQPARNVVISPVSRCYAAGLLVPQIKLMVVREDLECLFLHGASHVV
jgi:hypothetical protein